MIAQAPAVLSGGLVALSFPVFGLYPLAWIAFVPHLLSVRKKTGNEAFRSGFFFGLVSFFGTLYWIYHSINHYGGVPFVGSIAAVLLLCCYLSLYPAVFSFIFARMFRNTKMPALLIAPVLWTALEYLRSYALTGFPWSSIGYSQYRFLHIIQIADMTGIYGVSFLILAVNGAVADIISLKDRMRETPLFPLSYPLAGCVMLCLCLLFSLGYGTWRLKQERPGSPVNVAIIQGNIEQDKKWDPEYQDEVLEAYFALSREASASSPDLIVWPETAVPFFYGRDVGLTGRLTEFQQGLNTHLLFGSVLLKEESGGRISLSNSALLLDRTGKPIYKYDKIHMVPFGEYVPLRSVLFFIDKLVVGIGDYIPGDQYVRAGTEFGRFGTMICYEIIFPGLVRKFYTKGGDFIVTITNDAWFGKTAGPYQHFSMAVFRAIENRKPVIRAANSGISGLIDSAGRIISSTPLFVRSALSGMIRTDGSLTVYTKYGDLFSFACIVMSIIFLVDRKLWR